MSPAGPWLLAIESATETASAALLRGGEPVALRFADADRPASEALLPAVLALLEEQGLRVEALDAFAVSIGPGSFTGLRVGSATVKGLAFGAGAVVAPVPTLAALAAKGAAVAASGQVVAALDARRGEVYAAAYDGRDLLAAPAWGPAVLTPAELAPRLRAAPVPPLVVGDGVAVLEPALGRALGAQVRWLAPPEGTPDAAWVGRIGAAVLAAGGGIAPAALAPAYVRRAEAEVRRTGARFEPA